MTNQSGIYYLHGQSTSRGHRTAMREVQKIRATVTAGLSDLLGATFDSVDDSLFELANNARNNNEQNRFFEAMRDVRIKRKGVEKRFLESIHNLFENPPEPSALRASHRIDPTVDSLSLVDNDVLEEQVAVTAMVTKAQAHFQGVLLQLQARFSTVYERAETAPFNPLNPEHICGVFADSISDLDIHVRERLIVLKQFDRYVVTNLGILLDEANRILIQGGVAAGFKPTQGQSETTERPAAPDHNASTARSEDTQAASLNAIRQLLSRSTDYRLSVPAGNASNIHIINGGELHALLLRLPSQPTTTDLTQGTAVALDLRQIIAEVLAEREAQDGKSAALRAMDEDLINLVSMLFEFILDDYNLPPPIQVLISRLQIPILKVVMRDKSFFSKPSHPARRLLNTLARAGIGWSDSSEKSRDKLYEQIHGIVARILERHDSDAEIFETLNEEFDQFLARENRRTTLVEQRTREAEKGRIKSQKAQETVDQILAEKLHNHAVPENIRNILQNGWSRVMFLAYLRDDNEHLWTQTVQIIDDLLWCLDPGPQKADREQWVRLVPALLKKIGKGLEEVSYNASRREEMMSDLKRELIESFRRQTRKVAPADNATAPASSAAPPPKPAIEHQQELERATMLEYTTAIEAIGIGTWVEFSLVNGTRFRCKLSSVIDEADSYVFVNRMGLKVVEKKRMELANDLKKGRLVLLEHSPLIDRALDSVVGNLRRRAG